jgi:HEAT repeat protein
MTPQNAKPVAADLIKEFRDLADELGSPWNLGVRQERYRRTPERAARVARMNALIPEMRSALPAKTLTALMEDENIDTRTWAFMRFDDLDEELSRAALASIAEHVSTHEAFEAIAHARKPPPKQPTLPDMSVAELVARFADACLREFWARHTGSDDDPMGQELQNKIIDEVGAIIRELSSRGALDRLLPFLDAPNIVLRGSAASATLRIAPERAVPVLEEIATQKNGADSFWASQALKAHERGETPW